MNVSFTYLLPDQRLKSTPLKDGDIINYQNGKKKRKVYENCQYDQLQLRQIQQFKQYAKPFQDISNVPDKTLLRYLYSFDFKHSQALQKLNIYLQWYSDPKIQRLDQKTLQIINSGFCYTYGRDLFLRPIIYLNMALIDMQKYTIQDYLSATNAVITLVIQKLFIKGKLENYMFIMDTDNKNFTSLPLSVVKQMALKLSYVYSMRMGKMLLINCNYLIKLMFSAVSPFLADVTRQKINLISYSEVQQGKLKQYIDINEMQQRYGGFRENLTQKWPPRIPGKQLPTKIKHKHQVHQLCEYEFNRQQQQSIVRQQNILMLQEQQQDAYHQSQYFSCENDQQVFYKLDQKVVINQGCCAVQQCCIY